MSEEIEFLREHLKEICAFKGLQEELTYDVSLDTLKRVCKALDYLQQENQSLKDRIENIEKYVDWHIEAISNDIEDYLDDDPIENKHIIGEFKEDREHWRDVKKIINNQEDLYMDFILKGDK